MKTFHVFAFFTSIVIITVIILLFRSRESFENENLSLEERLLSAFKKDELKTFIKYLNFLNDNKNMSTRLVSEEVYNTLRNKADLSLDDIKSNM